VGAEGLEPPNLTDVNRVAEWARIGGHGCIWQRSVWPAVGLDVWPPVDGRRGLSVPLMCVIGYPVSDDGLSSFKRGIFGLNARKGID
jgi:hypothetical protein